MLLDPGARCRSARGPRRPRCDDCRFFDNDPAMLERTFKGLTVFSSAYGSTRGEAGLCSLHGVFLHPRRGCPDHRPRGQR